MIGLDHPFDVVMVIIVSTVAMLVFAAATQGYFFARSKIWESAALLLIAFTLFRPGFWLDLIEPPYDNLPATTIIEDAEGMPENSSILLDVEGINIEGEEISKSVMLPLGPAGSGEDRLYNAGIGIRNEDGRIFIDDLVFAGPAEKAGLDFDFEITAVKVEADRLPKEVFFIPAFLLLGGIIVLQRRRKRAEGALGTV
jgi:hypothetical protein